MGGMKPGPIRRLGASICPLVSRDEPRLKSQTEYLRGQLARPRRANLPLPFLSLRSGVMNSCTDSARARCYNSVPLANLRCTNLPMWRLSYALRQDRRRVLASLLATVGVLWTLVEVGSYFLDFEDLRRPPFLLLFLALGMFIAVIIGTRPREIRLTIPSSDTRLEIRVADIFGVAGCKVVPVNEFFDSSLGDQVSPLSLHGQFLQTIPSAYTDAFRASLAESLSSLTGELVTRHGAPATKFPIGTTVAFDVGQDRYILLALSHTSPTTDEASATIHDLWRALSTLWDAARSLAGGRDVVIPLIGGGLSKVGLPEAVLLDVIITSLLVATKERKIAARVILTLTDSHLSTIDLSRTQRRWT